jgi:hypothetical protein
VYYEFCWWARGNNDAAKRKLDSLGYIKSFSGVQNDPDHLRRLTNTLELGQYLANAGAKESAANKAGGETETQLIARAAQNKLITRRLDATKLT